MSDQKTPSLSDDVKIEELLSEKEREELESKYGELTAVKTKAGVAVFRCFKRAEYARYNKLLFEDKTRPQAFEALVCACVIKPSAEIFQGWLDKYPAITETCLNHVLELGGADKDAAAKKYGTA